MWFDQFKLAIITEKSEEIVKLLNEMPKFNSLEEMKKASYLLAEAHKMMSELKEKTAKSINQLKKNIDFMDATYTDKNYKIDIKS